MKEQKNGQRTKNAIRNIFWGISHKLIMIILPFINRTLMIYMMGNEYIGLVSLFKSILSVLNLTELGIGSALVYHMYRPIAHEDKDTICALMNFYKKCYRIIGCIVLTIGCILMPFLQHFIKGTVPQGINIYFLYVLYLAQTCFTYTLFSYKNSLLNAHQRQDIIYKVTICANIICLLLQAGILIVTKDIYLYVCIGVVFEAVRNIAQAIIVNRMYPDYKCKGKIDRDILIDIKKKVIGLLSSNVGDVVINSADDIIISTFLGLTVLGIYNNYYYILAAIIGILNVILRSLTAGIANSIVTQSVEKNHADFNKFTFIYQWIVSWCTVALLCLYQPFMSLWNPEGMMPFYVVILLVFRFFTGRCIKMTFIYKDATGLWWEDRYRPIIAAGINLVVNIILVNIIGIAGVIISTFVCSIFINTPRGTYILFKKYFKTGLKEHFIKLLRCYVVTTIVCIVTYAICNIVDASKVINLLVRGGICVLVPNLLFVVCYYKTQEFKATREFFNRILKR